MNTKKIFTVIFLGCSLLVGWSLPAAADWHTCTVNQAGPLGTNETSNSSRIFLTDNAASPAWEGSKEFKTATTRDKEFLAVALTAMATGKKVVIYSTLTGTFPKIKAIYLQEE